MTRLGSPLPHLRYERELYASGLTSIAGIDEAGRGALAGPVVAAAVILPLESSGVKETLEGVRDSKRMTPRQRGVWYLRIKDVARAWAVGSASPQDVDAFGLLQATRLAMRRSLIGLGVTPDFLLIDYVLLPEAEAPQAAFVRGEDHSLSIASASVLAKVTRDRWMMALDSRYPGYALGKHKGYATEEHRAALARLGPCPMHRRSYAPVAAHLAIRPGI
jgi:ribonuclease HII